MSSILLFCLTVFFTIPPQQAFARAPLTLTAPAAYIYETSTNRVLFSKNSTTRRAPASTTKVLTAMVVIDRLPMNKIITIPKFAESIQPTKINLKAGERYYVRDLVRAILIKSANDAAEVLGVAVAGSRLNFSKLLNQKARAIGATRSNFVRPSGLPAENQYSTAKDLAKIMKHASNYKFIVETLKKRTMTIESLSGRKIYLKNHNKMLWKDSRVIGKTGWTRKARYCFVGQISVLGKVVSFAMLGSKSLWTDLKRIVSFHFGSSYRKINTNKKLWATKPEVMKVQRALRNSGHNPGTIDGVFGSKTLAASKAFQRAQGLSADGIVGPKTWSKLKNYL